MKKQSLIELRKIGHDLASNYLWPYNKIMTISPKNSPRGFTLVELLVVVLLVATLATIAISSYINSTDTFSFLSEYKNVMSSLRTARSYAITNKDTGGEVPERYGVFMATGGVTAFADSGANDFVFDFGGDPSSNDAVIKNYSFADYAIQAQNSAVTHDDITMPVTIFYEIGSGELTIFDGDATIIDKNAEKYIALRFYETAGDLEKYVVMFQVSGLPEEFNDLSTL